MKKTSAKKEGNRSAPTCRAAAWLTGRGFSAEAFFVALFCGFVFASFDAVLRAELTGGASFTDLAFVSEVNLLRFCLVFALFSAFLIGIALLGKSSTFSHDCLFIGCLAFAYLLVKIESAEVYRETASPDLVFLLGVACVIFLVMKYLSRGDKLRLGKLAETKVFSSWRIGFLLVSAAVIGFTLVVFFATYNRYRSYSAPTYDFGIFAQMFESMAKTGLPLTTLERGETLSHFAVHFSPSWYLLLPGYFLVRHPGYLFFANAFVIALGAIPLYGICKKMNTTPLFALASSLLYLFFPSMSGSAFWDIHENSLLPVLILATVYFCLSDKLVPTFLFALLTLGTKEDSAVYIGAFALYLLFATKKKKTGIALLMI